MSHATITIDGQTILNGDYTHWQRQPPEFLTQLAGQLTAKKTGTPISPHQPWYIHAGIALTDALAKAQPINITIHTHTQGWTMQVEQP
jgi:hypothetical protein